MGADEGGPAVDAENLGDGITPRDSTLRGFDRSASPTMKSTSMSTPGSGFSFGRKTLGFWDKPNTVMMRNNVILHNTCGATGRAGVHNAPGPGARLHRAPPWGEQWVSGSCSRRAADVSIQPTLPACASGAAAWAERPRWASVRLAP